MMKRFVIDWNLNNEPSSQRSVLGGVVAIYKDFPAGIASGE
jgi:hypothetical protein